MATVNVTALITARREEAGRHYIDVTLTDTTNSESTNISVQVLESDPADTAAAINAILDAEMTTYAKRSLWLTEIDDIITAATARELAVET